MAVDLAAAVERADLDELLGVVNSLCLDADWDGVEQLAARCRAAFERGRQLWPIAAHADYRLALEAPPRWAAATVEPGRGRFSPGPLTEVVASTHTWAELAPHLPTGPLRAVVAQERVVRGEDLSSAADLGVPAEVPLALARWEPAYLLASYHPDRAEFPAPDLAPQGEAVEAGREPSAPGAGDEADVAALLELAGAWTAESAGRARAVAVEADAAGAAAALDVDVVRLLPVSARAAVAQMAWAGASGGAHGRRRGMAAGRFSAWWALAALAGLGEEWPPPADELGEALEQMRFFTFEDRASPVTGWRLALAVDEPEAGLAWAVWAVDAGEAAYEAGPSTRSV
ncbi:MAG TPA: hypothetical protein VE990_00755 [Acidimicrobiales bacterium]|nr:hypothetical protein [Acidimicrobiales bacterium]